MVKEMTSNRNSLRETQITCWRRRLRGWELGDLEELDALVGGVKLSYTKDQLLQMDTNYYLKQILTLQDGK